MYRLALIGLLLVSPRVAATPRQEALQLVQEGNRLLKADDCQGALARFESAKRLYPDSYKIEVNLGSALECLGQLPRAAEHFESFLGRSDELSEPQMRAAVQQRLDRLRQQLARLEVSCPAEGAAVVVDDRRVGLTPLRWPIYLKPGAHALSVNKPNQPLFQWQGDLAAGEQRRLIVPWLVRDPLRRKVPRVPKELLVHRPPTRPWYRRWWFWTLVGTAVVGATVAIVVTTRPKGSEWMPSGEAGTISLH